jgi:hypothetical protein
MGVTFKRSSRQMVTPWGDLYTDGMILSSARREFVSLLVNGLLLVPYPFTQPQEMSLCPHLGHLSM